MAPVHKLAEAGHIGGSPPAGPPEATNASDASDGKQKRIFRRTGMAPQDVGSVAKDRRRFWNPLPQ